MKKVATLIILLACYVLIDAHAKNHPEHMGEWNSFQSTVSAATLKRNETPYSSVVESWSLLCEELCGAGFGLPRCGSQCRDGITNKKEFNVTKYKHICPVLCDFELGGINCVCPYLLADVNSDEICNILCTEYHMHVKGCSICSTTTATESTITVTRENESVDETTTSNPVISITTTISSETDLSTETISETITPTTAFTDLSTETISETITPSTVSAATTNVLTTTAQVASTTTQPTLSSSTTPNWTEVCKNLCKSGEGGALCNCDLPPLMLQI